MPPRLRQPWRALAQAAAGVPLLLCFNSYVAQLMWISGPSMSPFLNADYDSSAAKDVVLVRMWKPWEDLRRGSVVTFWSPVNPEHMVVKRVVALAGDEVQPKPPYPRPGRQVVPAGHVWVEGDNVQDRKTMDSNWYGPVSTSLLVGRVAAVVWPWRSAGAVRAEHWRGSPRVREGAFPVVHPRSHPGSAE